MSPHPLRMCGRCMLGMRQVETVPVSNARSSDLSPSLPLLSRKQPTQIIRLLHQSSPEQRRDPDRIVVVVVCWPSSRALCVRGCKRG